MPYPFLDWQREALSALLGSWPTPCADGCGRPLRAALGLASRTLAAMEPKQPSLEAAVRRDAGRTVMADLVRETPFVRVVRFKAGETRRRILLLAPHSGYAAAVLSPLVAALLPLGEVWVTDWRDARLVPPGAGELGLPAQTRLAAELLLAADGRAVHCVGLSQAGPALLAAAALVAAHAPSLRPASLAFLGSQIDPRLGARPLQALLALWPRPVVAAQLTAQVPAGHPGAGRRVYPGLLQLLAFSASSPEVYLGIQNGLLLDLIEGRDRGFGRLHADIHCLIDIPAELFLDMLDWSVYRPALDRGSLTLGAERIDLAPLASVPLLTVEAARDELVGPGQTHALHQAVGAANGEARLDLAQARHHDLFTGPLFLAVLAPALRSFIREAGISIHRRAG